MPTCDFENNTAVSFFLFQIDTEKLADVEIGGVPEDQIVFDGDHNYTHRRVLELEPTNHSSAECQTDKTECHDSASQTADDSDFLRVKVKQYEHYIAKLKAQLKEKEKSVMAFNHHMIKDDKLALFWTGLPNKGVFMALYGFFEPKAKNLKFSRTVGGGAPRYSHSASSKRKTGKENKISLIDELFATLVRLKVGLLVPDISQRLGISTGHFSKMFEKWIQFLRNELSQLTRFPSLQEMRQYLPEQFHQYPNTRVIIDCTEIFCQKPSSLKSQRQLWSNYKHHNTYKALVGISPDGTVVFVSNLYGGSCSDKFITKDCGILDHLEPGDSVMADRGFLIEDLLGEGVSLNLPPFRDSKDSQLSAKQVEETRRIAAVRIHVERAIQRIKVFHILDGVMPLSLHHNAEDIFKVCAYLTNFQTPIIA